MYSTPIYRVMLVKDGDYPSENENIRDSASAAKEIAGYIGLADREHFVVMLLNRKNKVLGINTVSIGGLSSSIVEPALVFKPAFLASAAAIIVGHNHPSGDPTPSAEDRAVTKRLSEVGKLMGVQLLDHIVVGDDGRYYSFGDHGSMDT